MDIRPAGAALITCRQTDIHDGDNQNFFRLCERTWESYTDKTFKTNCMSDFWQEITYFHYFLPFTQKKPKISCYRVHFASKQLSSFKINIPRIIYKQRRISPQSQTLLESSRNYCNTKKVNKSNYRPEVSRGFQEVKVPRFSDNGPGWW